MCWTTTHMFDLHAALWILGLISFIAQVYFYNLVTFPNWYRRLQSYQLNWVI